MNQPLALVIDDEPDICELLTLTLGRMDIRTETAMDVAGAKTLLGEHDFDICLTDMRLPDGDGLEFQAGQYVNLELPGVDQPRAFSMANGPDETGMLELNVRHVPGGEATTYIHEQLKTGDRVLTSGGVLGVVVGVKEKTVSIRSADTKLEDKMKMEQGRILS